MSGGVGLVRRGVWVRLARVLDGGWLVTAWYGLRLRNTLLVYLYIQILQYVYTKVQGRRWARKRAGRGRVKGAGS